MNACVFSKGLSGDNMQNDLQKSKTNSGKPIRRPSQEFREKKVIQTWGVAVSEWREVGRCEKFFKGRINFKLIRCAYQEEGRVKDDIQAPGLEQY